jgi:radical SAM protein with 4Fe4S-binding SPASM domain
MGIDVVINILLHQGNYRQIGEMIDIAKSRGLYFNISSEITDRYDGTGGTSLWRLTEEQNKWLYQSDFSHYFDFDNSEKNVQCSCARTVCGINYKGDIYPCIGAPMFSGSVMKESFSAIWNDSKALNGIRNLTKEDFSECMECELIEKCSRSSGSVYVNTGKYTGCEEQTRKEAKLRKNFFTVKK